MITDLHTSDPVGPHVVAIADSDSYLKWSAATLDAMPPQWRREQWLVTSPIAPSAAQAAAATRRQVRRLTIARMVAMLARRTPDVILVACTGPVVQAVISLVGLLDRRVAGFRRPVIITGLPGISVPATERAIEFRRGADAFVLHSRRERTEFVELAGRLGAPIRFVLAQLPFVAELSARAPSPATDGKTMIVFAAQAKVPPEPEQRRAVLRALAELPGDRHGVVKVRALAGEQQTHRELWSYPELWDDLVAAGDYPPDAVSFRAGSMTEALESAAGFVTVSSTAALEAISQHVPILVLNDFGVSEEMINEVFLGSGCLGSLLQLSRDELCHPDPGWLGDNYFHPAGECDWTQVISALLQRREAEGLPVIDYGTGSEQLDRRRRFRNAVRLVLPARAVTVIRRGTRTFRRARRVIRSSAGAPGGEHPFADVADGPGSG